MASKKDLRSYFNVVSEKKKKKDSAVSVSEIIVSETSDVSQAEVDMGREQVKKQVIQRKNYQVVPEKVKIEVGRHAALKEFHVTYTKNHWSNFEKCVELFKKVIFPYLQAKKKEFGYPEEQYSLIIMDTFKGQDNEAMKSFCNKNNCELVIVPHNLTNKFQPLDLTINQKAKKYVSSKFNEWYAERVSKQLMNGKAPGDVKFSLKLSDLKPLHAKWIVDVWVSKAAKGVCRQRF